MKVSLRGLAYEAGGLNSRRILLRHLHADPLHVRQKYRIRVCATTSYSWN